MTLVKICGLTSAAALEAAVACGADALGFVLAPSPRRLSPARARELLRLVPPGIERIAVFARAGRHEVALALDLGFDGLQAELAAGTRPPLPAPIYWLPVLRDGADLPSRLARIEPYPGDGRGSLRGALVLDGPGGGGRGLPVDGERARRAARSRSIVLAGGLTPANVAERVHAIRPFAVDTSSGVERERGVKDPELIRAFVASVRAAGGPHACEERT
jgi:phosphoribosylanthranilate isomerase